MKTYSFPDPSFFAGYPDVLPPSRLPDLQTELRNKAVCDEREACARLVEQHGPHAIAAEIRARGGVTPTPASNETRKAALHQVEPLRDIGMGKAIADAVDKMLRENPPPPDELLPDGCSRWVLVTLPYRDDEPDVLWFKWEAKR
jgi:hypothetical protein